MTLFKSKKCAPFYVFSGFIIAFFLFFSKIIPKSDDGHFIGILSEDGFNILKWLEYRYESISGRSVCEFLTMAFFSVDPVFNKIFFALLWIVWVWLMMKIISAYGDDSLEEKVFVCSIPFSILITCLNSGAIWFSGGFTYFVPFVFMTAALSPSIFDVLNIDYNRAVLIPASVVCAYMSSSQEQSSALTVTFLLILLAVLIKKKIFRFYHLLPPVAAAIETFFLFNAPGMRKRTAAEAASFPEFYSMSVLKKVLCGFSNYFAFEFLTSFFVSGLFVLLLIFTLKRIHGMRDKLSLFIAGMWGTLCVLMNVLYVVFNHTNPDKGFEQAFKSGDLSLFDIMLIAAGLLFISCLLAAIIIVAREEPETGIAVFLCFSAGICSAVVLGFSSSIYASGQRVFFFSEILMLISSAILFARLDNVKIKKNVARVIFLFSLVMFLFDCLSFAFMETPVMG